MTIQEAEKEQMQKIEDTFYEYYYPSIQMHLSSDVHTLNKLADDKAIEKFLQYFVILNLEEIEYVSNVYVYMYISNYIVKGETHLYDDQGVYARYTETFKDSNNRKIQDAISNIFMDYMWLKAQEIMLHRGISAEDIRANVSDLSLCINNAGIRLSLLVYNNIMPIYDFEVRMLCPTVDDEKTINKVYDMIFCHTGAETYDPGKLTGPLNSVILKPDKVLWGSPVYVSDEMSDWDVYIRSEFFRDTNNKISNKHFKFRLAPETPVLVINNQRDLDRLPYVDFYEYKESEQNPLEYREFGIMPFEDIHNPNWKLISKLSGAIYATKPENPNALWSVESIAVLFPDLVKCVDA